MHTRAPVNVQAGILLLAFTFRARDVKPKDYSRLQLPTADSEGHNEEKAGQTKEEQARQYLATIPQDAPVFLSPSPSSPSSSSSSSKASFLVNTYVQYKLHSLFGGAFEHQELGPLPITYPVPTPAHISATSRLLFTAKRPVLLLQSQVMLSPALALELQRAVRSLGIPVFLGGMARGLLGKADPLHIRQVHLPARPPVHRKLSFPLLFLLFIFPFFHFFLYLPSESVCLVGQMVSTLHSGSNTLKKNLSY